MPFGASAARRRYHVEGSIRLRVVTIVDVEGAEASVFAGFSISRWKPTMIIAELTHTHPDLHVISAGDAHLQSAIQKAGYSVVYKDAINTVFARASAVQR